MTQRKSHIVENEEEKRTRMKRRGKRDKETSERPTYKKMSEKV